MYVYACIYARMYVYVGICMYIRIFIHVRISVYACICQYICNWVWNIHTYTYIYIQYMHILVYIQYTYCTYIAVYLDHIRTYMISNFIYWHILTCRFTDAGWPTSGGQGPSRGRRSHNRTAFFTAIGHFSHGGSTTSFRRSIMPYNARAWPVSLALARPCAHGRANINVFMLPPPAGRHLETGATEYCNLSRFCV